MFFIPFIIHITLHSITHNLDQVITNILLLTILAIWHSIREPIATTHLNYQQAIHHPIIHSLTTFWWKVIVRGGSIS